MSFVETIGKFHISLDGVGLILQGATERPAYRVGNAPVYGTRFASGDRDYNDLSQWWYLIQTDWSGGVKEQISFEDDAKFSYSSNIDARTKPGTLRLERQVALEYDHSAQLAEIMAVFTSIRSGDAVTHFIDDNLSYNLSGSAAWDSNDDPSNELGRGDYLWSFGDTVQNSSTASPYPFVSSDKTSYINTIIDGSIDIDGTFGIKVGTALYVCGMSTTDKLFIVKTTVANPASSGDWSLVYEGEVGNSLGAKMAGAKVLGGELVILIAGEPEWGLYSLDIAAGLVTELRQFSGSTQLGIFYRGGRYVQNFNDGLLITICREGDDSEDGDIWWYNGSTLEKIYGMDEAKIDYSTREAKPWLKGGATIYGNFAFWGNLVYDGTSFFNFIKAFDDNPDHVAIPVGTNGEYLYLTDNIVASAHDQLKLYKYNENGTAYKDGANNEAFLVFSQHDKLQSIDKLLNEITIGFEQFIADQGIRVYYTTNPIPDPNITTGDWTLLGTASYDLDGDTVTSKKFPFPTGSTAKKIWFRVELFSAGTDTPGLTDFTLEYLPMPDYRFQWNVNFNCSDEVRRIDGRKMETTARELKARLMKAWQTKSALDFGDIDYAQTLMNDATPSASDTTITVDSTQFFPEQGRIKINDEEIYYTGKTPFAFTGCTRGARGTRAADHADNAVVHNGYRVLIVDVDVSIPALLEDKNTEYIVGLTLREV